MVATSRGPDPATGSLRACAVLRRCGDLREDLRHHRRLRRRGRLRDKRAAHTGLNYLKNKVEFICQMCPRLFFPSLTLQWPATASRYASSPPRATPSQSVSRQNNRKSLLPSSFPSFCGNLQSLFVHCMWIARGQIRLIEGETERDIRRPLSLPASAWSTKRGCIPNRFFPLPLLQVHYSTTEILYKGEEKRKVMVRFGGGKQSSPLSHPLLQQGLFYVPRWESRVFFIALCEQQLSHLVSLFQNKKHFSA